MSRTTPHFNMVVLLGSLFAMACGQTDSAQATPPGTQWKIEDGGNGHFYLPVIKGSGGIDWATANAEAIGLGGHLATITSQSENDFVFALINDPSFWNFHSSRAFGPWIGGLQPPGSPEPAGGWEWVTGEPFVYTNWEAGEPNQFLGNDEDRIHFFVHGNVPVDRWNDQPGFTRDPVAYVAEFVPEPSSFFLVTVGMAVIGLFTRARRGPATA